MPMDVWILLVAGFALALPITITLARNMLEHFLVWAFRGLDEEGWITALWLPFVGAWAGAMMGLALTEAPEGLGWMFGAGAVIVVGGAITASHKRLSLRTPMSPASAAVWEKVLAEVMARSDIDRRSRRSYEQYADTLDQRAEALLDQARAMNRGAFRRGRTWKHWLCSTVWLVAAIGLAIGLTAWRHSALFLALIPLGASLTAAALLHYFYRRRLVRFDGLEFKRAAEAIRTRAQQLTAATAWWRPVRWWN